VSDEILRVALTFDAEHPDRAGCPPGNAERILDALSAEAIRASFFVQGRWAESQPACAKRIADGGHLVGHHSHYHARMSLLSDEGIDSDVLDGQRVISEHIGVDPRPWFRCPFGDGHDDARVLARLKGHGYRNVHWHVESQDWEPWRTGEAIAEDAVAGVRAHGDGAVVLLHTWPKGTGDAVGSIIARLQEMGATFVRLDELEDLPS
jgi:peptidoglycan/xylan/chitin deacetylase (PgdA/CDA1 family)